MAIMILFFGLRTLVEFNGEIPLGGFLSDDLPSKQGCGQHHLWYPSQFTLISLKLGTNLNRPMRFAHFSSSYYKFALVLAYFKEGVSILVMESKVKVKNHI